MRHSKMVSGASWICPDNRDELAHARRQQGSAVADGRGLNRTALGEGERASTAYLLVEAPLRADHRRYSAHFRSFGCWLSPP